MAPCQAAKKAHCLPLVSWWGCREGAEMETGYAERESTFLRTEDCMGVLFIGKVGGLRDSEAVPRGAQR